MKVILKSDVEKLGRAGDVKQVADGFGRNYLLPRGLATPATPAALKWLERGAERRQKLREKASQAAQELAGRLAGVALSFARQAGEEGKIFGSVGKSDIVESLKASGIVVDKKSVILPSALKALGEHEVEIRLAPDVSTKIKVSVVARA